MFHRLSIKELHQGYTKGDFTSTEVTEYFLDRIAKYDTKLNSFISVTGEHAIEQAKNADIAIQNGTAKNMLAGIPIAQKDIFCTNGIKTTCCSKILSEFKPL